MTARFCSMEKSAEHSMAISVDGGHRGTRDFGRYHGIFHAKVLSA